MGDSEWRTRQDARELEVKKLEEEAERTHEALMREWHRESPAFELLSHDREIKAKLEEARRELKLGLKAKPKPEETK